jgi:hypothetical protein
MRREPGMGGEGGGLDQRRIEVGMTAEASGRGKARTSLANALTPPPLLRHQPPTDHAYS